MKRAALFLLLPLFSTPIAAMSRLQGDCSKGGASIYAPLSAGQIPQLRSMMQSFPSCTVSVFNAGTTTPVLIYSTNTGTPLANPFQADIFGHWFFYAANGIYDVQISGGSMPQPYTFGALQAFDFTAGGGVPLSFSLITSGTNINQTLTVGNNSVLTYGGSGQLKASQIADSSGNISILPIAVAGATDYITATNGAAGAPGIVQLGAAGTDTNIDLLLTPKGTGALELGSPSTFIDSSGNLTTPGGLSTSKINGVFYMDGNTYPCTTGGLQAILAAVLAAGGGTADARGCPTVSITSQINIGNTAGVPVVLELPIGGVWTVTGITDGTSCAFQQFGATRIRTSGSVNNAFQLHAGANTNKLGALYCTAATGSEYYNVDNVVFYNPNGAAMTNGAFWVRPGGINDNSIWEDVTVASYGTLGANITSGCCAATFRNFTSNGNHVAASVPLQIVNSTPGLVFLNASIDHPGAGLPNIRIVGTNSTVTFAGTLYLESNITDTTTALIQITDAGSGSTFVANTIFSSPSSAGNTAYVIQNSGTSPVVVSSLQRRGNSSGTNAINEAGKGYTIANDALGNVSYNSQNITLAGRVNVGPPSVTGQLAISSNATMVDAIAMTDTEAGGKSVGFGPGAIAVGRVSIVDISDGPNTELFSCALATTGGCGGKALVLGTVGGVTYGNGTMNYLETTQPPGLATIDLCYGDSTVHAIRCNFNNAGFFAQPQTINSGTATMTTAAIGSLACGTTVAVTASGVATTDAISWAYNAGPAANPGELVVNAWAGAGTVNFAYCNPTAGSVTPNAATLNWRVVR